jgi:dCTP deaminase
LNLPRRAVGPRTGVLPSQALHALIERKEIFAADTDVDPGQVQPASLDLRLGPIAYRIRASFLPGKGGTVESKLSAMQSHVIDLSKGAVLETECVYLVPLMERLTCAPRSPRRPTRRAPQAARCVHAG